MVSQMALVLATVALASVAAAVVGPQRGLEYSGKCPCPRVCLTYHKLLLTDLSHITVDNSTKLDQFRLCLLVR